VPLALRDGCGYRYVGTALAAFGTNWKWTRGFWPCKQLPLKALYLFGFLISCFFVIPAQAQTFGCSPAMANDIVCENSKAGSPPSAWDISGAGDLTIQGFATDISVNQGGAVNFKINTDAKAYTIEIYRVGYYGGNGARLITAINPSVTLPQRQPACITDSTTHLYDCGTWAVSASWQVPSNATSGVYFAHLIRTDTGGDSHIVFIVRNDSSHSDILYQTSDEAWQAYNDYGMGSLYGPPGGFDLSNRAYKVSYNRPFTTRGFENEAATWLFGPEFPMIQWLEQNGYDVTYFTGVDAARNGSLILNHKIYTNSGHDEYWTLQHRNNVEAARDAGVNMAFFSGNEVFWKLRWENSVDGSNTSYRTLVCYKETLAFAKIDPNDPPTWTGTWRDPTFSPPADGNRPENSLTGTIFMVNGSGDDTLGLSIKVPQADGKMRFWRNTSLARLGAGQTGTLPGGTLGYEWDEDLDNGSRPAGLFHLSTSTYTVSQDLLLDYGATYGAGTATHHLTLYRAPSGALVFGAGTVQWSWGLNSNHDNPFSEPTPAADPDMQQATVNLFADMGVQPATLQGGLIAASKSTDTSPPTSYIISPTSGSSVTVGSSVTISGTAADQGGGVVGGIEVSVDGGTTWHPANGRESWTYTWTPRQVGSVTVKSRAVDDSANLETPGAGISVTVNAQTCPCSDWSSSISPVQVDGGDGTAISVGVKFKVDFNGYITGIRFYKASTNTGTHIGSVWTSTGTLLGSATFSGETSSGWQQVNFSNPVAVTANTLYVASYFAPNGHYSADPQYFATAGVDNPPVHLLANSVSADGVYTYGSTNSFPNSSFNATNYWVDVVYVQAAQLPPGLQISPSTLSFTASVGSGNPPSQTVSIANQGSGTLNWTASSNATWLTVSPPSGTTPGTLTASANTAGLASGNYTATITISSAGANNSPQTVSVSLAVTNVLMATNFGTQGAQGWIASPLGFANGWSVVNQALQYSGLGNAQIYAGNAGWTNYTVSVPIKFSTVSNYPGGIRARVNPSTGAGYMLWAYPALGEFILYRNSAWNINSVTQIGQATVVFDTANFHNVTLSFTGSQIQVLYDGQTIMSVTDTTYTSGLVALEGYNQPITFGNVVVSGPSPNSVSLTTVPSSFNFSANLGGPNPVSQTLQLSNTGGALVWTAVSSASWLSVSSNAGLTPASLQVSANSSSLGGGNYTGTITVVSLGAVNAVQVLNVNLTVILPPPSITLAPSSINFLSVIGQPAPPAQLLAVTNGGSGNFSFTVSTDSPWLVVSPTSGSTSASISISVNPSGLAAGSYTGHVIVTASGISNSPQSIPVSMQVLSQDLTENFSDLGSGWIISPMGMGSGWSVSNGVYSYSGLGLSQTCVGNSGWTDYTFDANIKLSNMSNWPGGVRARVNPATGAGYLVWLYPASGSVVLYSAPQWSVNGSGLTALAQAPLTFDTASFHDLRVRFQGTAISIYWDGKLLMTASDSTYSSGFVCLDADNQPISYSNIQVAALQASTTLAAAPSSLVFGAIPGSNPAAQTVNFSAGGAATSYGVTSSASWLSASASSTLTPGTITVSVTTNGLSQGTYNGTVTVSAPGSYNSPLVIPVTLAMKTAVLSVTPSPLTFFGAVGVNPNSQNLQISNVGTGTLSWSASKTTSWLGLSATSGVAPSTLAVSPNLSGLATGSYSDTVTVASSDATNGQIAVPVSMQIGNLLFNDNFSSGVGNWTISPLGFASGWSVANGAYSYNGGGHTQSWAGSNSWIDYTAAVDFQLSSTNDYPGGLRGRVNTGTGASYGAWIYPAEGMIRLYRIGQWNIDAGFSLLAQASGLKFDTNIHNLRLSFQGSTIQVYYDNVLVITATDATYAQGAIALDVSNQPISFRNVTVISLP
jgi:hypothetical protein